MSLLLNIFVLFLAWMFVQCNDQKEKQLIFLNVSEDNVRTVVSVNQIGGTPTECKLVTDNEDINKILKLADPGNIRKLSKKDVGYMLKLCVKLDLKKMKKNAVGTRNENDIDLERTTIYPGTKWCGDGTNAKDYDDLGEEAAVDRCCRAHDYCKDIIPAGETKHNITNHDKYTMLSCECDDEFYNCLKCIDDETATRIGFTYFNVLEKECYMYDYPLICTSTSWWSDECKEYRKDTSKEKVYRMNPAKFYNRIPSTWWYPVTKLYSYGIEKMISDDSKEPAACAIRA